MNCNDELNLNRASEELKNDKKFASIAVEKENDCDALIYFSEKLKDDETFLGELWGKNEKLIESISLLASERIRNEIKKDGDFLVGYL